MNDTVTCVVLCEGCDDETKAQMSEVLEFIYVYILLHNMYIYVCVRNKDDETKAQMSEVLAFLYIIYIYYMHIMHIYNTYIYMLRPVAAEYFKTNIFT